MIQRVDHIGILVSDMDASIKLYQEYFGAKLEKVETVAEQGVKAAILCLSEGANIELLEPLPGSNMAKTLEKRGEGVHHITFETDNVDADLVRLGEKGLELIDKKPRRGLEGMVGFIHPKSVRGVLVELCQKV